MSVFADFTRIRYHLQVLNDELREIHSIEDNLNAMRVFLPSVQTVSEAEKYGRFIDEQLRNVSKLKQSISGRINVLNKIRVLLGRISDNMQCELTDMFLQLRKKYKHKHSQYRIFVVRY